MRFPYVVFLSACVLMLALPLLAQSPNGVLNGIVVDASNSAIVGADVIAQNDTTGVQYRTKTNGEGIYVLPNLPPGPYRLQVSKFGFKSIIKPDITVHVQDALAMNFTLPVGTIAEVVTVTGGEPLVNTESAAVSTVVDRQFAENLPMNGRSFQTLIQLTPGVVTTQSTTTENGQFSVNGQRANANYWMVDGVSANIGTSAGNAASSGLAGGLPSFSVQGGTNSLVSIDAMQEFRIQTSTYAPEFGRSPGAQISILTRSGTNQFHGTAFDYLRNDIFDANDWFADSAGLPKPEERQNDFGGTVSGPIAKDRTFFFLSYEGLRLRLPQAGLTTVPDLASRQTALPELQPFMNAYPLPNGAEILEPCDPASDPACPPSGQKPTGAAQFNSRYSNSSSLDAYSLRVDHRIGAKLNLFGRYNYSPSHGIQRRPSSSTSLNVVQSPRITTQTTTVGASWTVTPTMTNDLRFNYSRVSSSGSFVLDSFGGAVVPSFSVVQASNLIPAPFTLQNANLNFFIVSLSGGILTSGYSSSNLQRQINIVDTYSVQEGSHSLKFGADYRRLTPRYGRPKYVQSALFLDLPSAQDGDLFATVVTAGNDDPTLLFQNLGIFAEDTWRVRPRLTLTYGLRWDVDFAPSSIQGPSLPAVTGYDLNNLSGLALAPAGTAPFATRYGNIAPRLGIAYQLSQSQVRPTVLRGGFGVFYDLATSEFGNLLVNHAYPFGASQVNCCFTDTFPLTQSAAAPPPITADGLPSGLLTAFDPHLNLPYTLQWNFAVEQGLGQEQRLSLSYVGAAGKRLMQTASITAPNPSFGSADLVGNTATSNYDALQVQLQRRLSSGLEALASYTWSHSIDDASGGSAGNFSNTVVPGVTPDANRGPSDFDTRQAVSVGFTYDIPTPKHNLLTAVLLRSWSLQSIVQARSAPPVDVFDGTLGILLNGATNIRPDLIPGIPLYLYGPQYPGGKRFNNTPGAGGSGCIGPFCDPPLDTNGVPIRQGNLGRNALRGFGAVQWDFAVHREFRVRESVRLQFRAEMFNLLNHPNFGQPVGDLSNPSFGLSTEMLGRSLSGSGAGSAGGFSPLYQVGGPRSMQFALKLLF